MTSTDENRKLIVHVIHRLNVGGLENGLINIINNLANDEYDHAIICMTESSRFGERINRKDVKIFELHKPEGKSLMSYIKLWRLLRELRPAIVHSRNTATIEASFVAALAGVPIRIHGEHGRDIHDLYGKNRKYKILRRMLSPFIDLFITMSKDLDQWLVRDVGIERAKVVQLYNGVNTERFAPPYRRHAKCGAIPREFVNEECFVIGTVGRLEEVKDHLSLIRAFLLLMKQHRDVCLRLIIVGEGSQRAKLERLLQENNAEESVWLAGSRDDVPELLPEFDVFVLPSLNEGISNTILEAMACGLPVVATNVGGNPELVKDGITGFLVTPSDPQALATALDQYVCSETLRETHGRNARAQVEKKFSLNAMVSNYKSVYDSLLRVPGTKPNLSV